MSPAENYNDIYVITAPSGTGKTTLNRRLMENPGGIEIAVSHTTRSRREGEVHGDHYWFVKKQEFFAEVQAGRMLESADVFGNFYGTSLKELERIRANQHKAILEIDVQGWTQAGKKLPGARSVFIMPPSMGELWKRLTGRASDSPEAQWRRITTARQELDQADKYQYLVVNDDLERAFAELKSILEERPALRLSHEEGIQHQQKLIREWNESREFEDLRNLHAEKLITESRKKA